MESASRKLSATFEAFFQSEKSAGYLLVACAAIAMLCANLPGGGAWLQFWQSKVGALSLQHWINDALMAVFFLLIGLELERELYVGELSKPTDAMLPGIAAVGGMAIPALIYYLINRGTSTVAGIGIPMATDIAFALCALSILGNRIPASLKVFVVAFAVIDDLGAIAVIALFYTAEVSLGYLAGALGAWAALVALNRIGRVAALSPYVIGGAVMWWMMLESGVHATVAGVALAFAIPFSAKSAGGVSPSHRLEHFLHKPVAFGILPLFALANTGVAVGSGWMRDIAAPNVIGITAGLLAGKVLGVTLFCAAAVAIGVCRLPPDLAWRHIIGAGMLGGIGFTMSIFITNLAFAGEPSIIDSSKLAVLAASLAAGAVGFLWLRLRGKPGCFS